MTIIESLLYQLDNCFDRRALQHPDARRKLQLFNAIVPFDCQSILDVGGGTGWVTLPFRERCQVVTLDRSSPSLLLGSGLRVLGDISRLPLADRSFDLVLSSQVLEHLPDSVLNETKIEMARVAKKYILVSVPYRERLSAKMVRCLFCGEIFHTDHHVRSFSEQDICGLFDDWILAEWHVFGILAKSAGPIDTKPTTRRRDTRPVRYANEHTTCPSCGKQGISIDSNIVTSSRSMGKLSKLKSCIYKQLPQCLKARFSNKSSSFLKQDKAPYWIAGLYIPTGSESYVDANVFDLIRDYRASE